jgi:ferredoxin-NADP reductase
MAGATVLRRLTWAIAEVVQRSDETPRVRSLTFDVPDWPGHLPGQHIDVRLTAEDGYRAQRSYSIASAPEDGYPSITVERLEDGEVSPYLVDDAQPGDAMEIRGPVGGWFVWDAEDGGPLMLVAGGSGVVPLRSILRHRTLAGSDAQARLLLSARTSDNVIYRDELTDVDVTLTYTRAAPDGWTGYARRVDRDMLAEVAFPPGESPRVYICGPTAFVEGVAADFVALGHHTDRIRTERFGATGG